MERGPELAVKAYGTCVYTDSCPDLKILGKIFVRGPKLQAVRDQV